MKVEYLRSRLAFSTAVLLAPDCRFGFPLSASKLIRTSSYLHLFLGKCVSNGFHPFASERCR